jgi:hypothetical protein
MIDSKEFISSGIIESCLLGSATDAEIAQVNEMANRFPEVRKEINKIEQGFLEFANLHRIDPPEDLKNKILNAIDRSKSKNGIYKSVSNETSVNTQSRERLLTFLMAACIILLLASIYINLMFFRKVSFLEQRVANINSEKELLVMRVNNQQMMIENANGQMNVALDPRFARVTLKGVEHSPNSLAAVFYSAETQQVYMHVYILPETSPEKQYQLWAIVEGKPVDAGMIDQNDTRKLFAMKNISNPQAFAITLEKRGGSPVPTLSEMYVMGNVNL